MARFTKHNKKQKHQSVICTLGSGIAFGESIIYDMIRSASIITSEICELLRVEQKDFRILWTKNREYMKEVISSLSPISVDKISSRRFSEFDQLNSFRLNVKDNPRHNPALTIVSVNILIFGHYKVFDRRINDQNKNYTKSKICLN